MSQNKKDIVFFSWQSDLDAKTNRNVIGDCIKIICKRNNLLYDEGTKDRCGSPDIARSIEEKIKSADIFIADVTIINAESQAKPTPNPNVLFELGIAQAILGWERITAGYSRLKLQATTKKFTSFYRNCDSFNNQEQSLKRDFERG